MARPPTTTPPAGAQRAARVAARSALAPDAARAFLGLPESYAAPPAGELERAARAIAKKTLAFGLELAHLAVSGLQLSPIWEVREGCVQLRLAVVPRELRTRYFEGEPAREALEDPDLFRLVAEVFELMVADPVGAAFALDDTHRVWFDAEGPVRKLALPARDHDRLLSMLVADGVRKLSAGLDTLEWLSTLGLPIDEMRDDDDPPASAIHAAADEQVAAMWAEEAGWTRAAFGRR